jgi:glycosyltransferase involved in cell wall biosynthesis
MGAPQARLSELAAHLVQKGHQVTVLTAMPNYPSGKIFQGYGGWFSKDEQDGVRIIRTGIYPVQNARVIPRLLSYFSFVFSSLLLGGWHLRKPVYILTESPPLFLGISGFLLSRWKRARWIFNVSDLWPDSALHLGVIQKGFVYKLAVKLEAFCYKNAWVVTGQSQTILDSITRRFPAVNTHLFANGVDVRRFSPSEVKPDAILAIGSKNVVTAIYAGLHGIAQGLEQILQAADQLRDILDLHFVLVGDGPEKINLMKMKESLNLSNVTFLDAVPRDQVPTLLTSTDICLITLKTHLPGAVPSKIYEAMASGKPIILAADDEPARIVASHKAGLVVPPGDISKLVSAIRKLYNDSTLRESLGNSGQIAVREFYNRRVIVDKFVHLLNEG